MSIFSKILKPSFYLNDNSKGMPLEESIELLKNYQILLESAPKASGKNNPDRSNTNDKVRTYLRGINEKCIQFELLYEIEVDDSSLFKNQDNIDLAEYYITLVNENFIFNMNRDKINVIEQSSDIGMVEVKINNENHKFHYSAIKLNDNNKYDKAFKNFTRSLSSSDLIERYKLFDISDNNLIEFLSSDFDKVELISEKEEKIIYEIKIEKEKCLVVPVGPILKNDMRRKWRISFQPEIPEHLIYDGNTEFLAYIKDKDFFDNNLVKEHDSFGIGHKLICDLRYVVYHVEDSLFCK